MNKTYTVIHSIHFTCIPRGLRSRRTDSFCSTFRKLSYRCTLVCWRM